MLVCTKITSSILPHIWFSVCRDLDEPIGCLDLRQLHVLVLISRSGKSKKKKKPLTWDRWDRCHMTIGKKTSYKCNFLCGAISYDQALLMQITSTGTAGTFLLFLCLNIWQTQVLATSNLYIVCSKQVKYIIHLQIFSSS